MWGCKRIIRKDAKAEKMTTKGAKNAKTYKGAVACALASMGCASLLLRAALPSV